MSKPRSRLPSILWWITFLLVLMVLGPIGYAVVSLDSRPGGSGADWPAKLLIALLVLAAASAAALAVRAVAALLIRALRRPAQGGSSGTGPGDGAPG